MAAAPPPPPRPPRPLPYGPDASLWEKLYWYFRKPIRPSEMLDTPQEFLNWAVQAACAAGTGMLLGGYLGAKDGKAIAGLAKMTPPPDQETAKQLVLRKAARSSSTKAVMMAVYFTSFVGIYGGVHNILLWHTHKNSVWHHSLGGFASGTLFGAIMLQGPIGLAYGSAVGTALGTASGLLWKASEYILPPIFFNPPSIPLQLPPELPADLGARMEHSLDYQLQSYEKYNRLFQEKQVPELETSKSDQVSK